MNTVFILFEDRCPNCEGSVKIVSIAGIADEADNFDCANKTIWPKPRCGVSASIEFRCVDCGSTFCCEKTTAGGDWVC